MNWSQKKVLNISHLSVGSCSELVDANISVFASEIRFKLYVVASHNFPMYFSRCLHNKC